MYQARKIIIGVVAVSYTHLIKDLMVDRTAYDKIMQAGGYVSVRTGAPQDANAIPVSYTHLISIRIIIRSMRRCRGIMAGRSYEKYDQNSKKNLPKDRK